MIDFDRFIVDEMDSTKEEIKPLYRIYCTEMIDMIEKLTLASDRDDSENFKKLLHNVKGINANMRIDTLTIPVTEIYQSLLNKETINLAEAINKISDIYSKVKIEIDNYFGDAI